MQSNELEELFKAQLKFASGFHDQDRLRCVKCFIIFFRSLNELTKITGCLNLTSNQILVCQLQVFGNFLESIKLAFDFDTDDLKTCEILFGEYKKNIMNGYGGPDQAYSSSEDVSENHESWEVGDSPFGS